MSGGQIRVDTSAYLVIRYNPFDEKLDPCVKLKVFIIGLCCIATSIHQFISMLEAKTEDCCLVHVTVLPFEVSSQCCRHTICVFPNSPLPSTPRFCQATNQRKKHKWRTCTIYNSKTVSGAFVSAPVPLLKVASFLVSHPSRHHGRSNRHQWRYSSSHVIFARRDMTQLEVVTMHSLSALYQPHLTVEAMILLEVAVRKGVNSHSSARKGQRRIAQILGLYR